MKWKWSWSECNNEMERKDKLKWNDEVEMKCGGETESIHFVQIKTGTKCLRMLNLCNAYHFISHSVSNAPSCYHPKCLRVNLFYAAFIHKVIHKEKLNCSLPSSTKKTWQGMLTILHAGTLKFMRIQELVSWGMCSFAVHPNKRMRCWVIFNQHQNLWHALSWHLNPMGNYMHHSSSASTYEPVSNQYSLDDEAAG